MCEFGHLYNQVTDLSFFVSLIQAAEVIVPEFLVEIINWGMCPQDHIIIQNF